MIHTPSLDLDEKYFNTLPLESLTTLNWERLTYAGVIAFATDGTMLCMDQPHRGIDIAGGHRDTGESPLEALVREGYEEIGISLTNSKVILIREGTRPYKGIEKPIMIYSVVTGIDKDKAFHDFGNRPISHRDEVSGISFKTPEEFLAEYRTKPSLGVEFLENMELAINEAKACMKNGAKMSIGMVGLGDHNIRGHLVPLNTDPRIGNVIVFDPKGEQSLNDLRTKYSTQYVGVDGKITLVSSDFRAIIDNPDISAVFISSPDQFHTQQTADSLRAGKHVFCEKPLIHTLDEVPKLVENILLAKEKGLILSSCHPRRFDPPFMWVKDYLNTDDGKDSIGDIRSFHFDFKYPAPEVGKEGLHSGLLSDHFNHEIDLVNFMFGFSHFTAERISDSQVKYEATGTREDGIIFHFTGTRKEPRGAHYAESITIQGTKGTITVDTETGDATLGVGGTKTVVHQGLHTNYITRFELTTGNMIDTIVAGGRNYLTRQDLFINSVSGAILTNQGSFNSRDYIEVLNKI